MSLQKILEKLEHEKAERIRQIEQEYEKKFEKLAQIEKEKFNAWKEEKLKKFEQTIAAEEYAVLSKERLFFKSEMTRIENEAIELVKRKLIETLLNLPKDTYTSIWEELIEKENLSGARLILAKGESKLDFEKLKKKYNLFVAEEKVDGEGGFVAEKGQFLLDLTLDTLVKEAIENNLSQIARILRGEI
ncbi:V-type proton ATPase subunit E [Pseudothermotoga sp.]|uniref:V-type proton ATPase subunit E n=1 Tax=Pseudothermotoga sp. TaxID=2033661 RepID=UPI0031F60752